MFKRLIEHTYPVMRERRDDDGHEIDAIYAVDSYIETGKPPTMDGMFKDWCEAWKGLASVLTEQTKSNEPVDDELSSALFCLRLDVSPLLRPRHHIAHILPHP